MSLRDHPKAYGTAAVAAAFTIGVMVTLGFKDLYPDLERRFQQARRRKRDRNRDPSRRSSLFFGPVKLEDHESDPDALAAETHASVARGVEGCIGNTPLVELRSLSEATGCVVLAKAELLNPGGSPKDRVALAIIRAAEASGELVPGRGDTIYEGTVGSTGISIATLARALGYRAHICMPDDQSREKSDLLREMGAVVERVPVAPIVDPAHFVNLARRRAAEHTAAAGESRGFFADQFESAANADAHRSTTGPEILRQCSGHVDAFVAGAGTGGTVAGVARYLKEDARVAGVRVVLADPQGSGLYHRVRHGVLYSPTEKEGTRRRTQVDSVVEGIGMNRMTAIMEGGLPLVDDAVRVTDVQAMRMGRWLVEREGIFAGSSSAVNCVAAVATALSLPKGSTVVTVLCDSGFRHISKFYKKIGEAGFEGSEKTGEGVQEDLLSLLGLKSRE
jgi:cysteine synthase